MHRYFTVAATCLPLIFATAPVSADSMPPDIAEKVAALGRVIAPPQTNAIYAPLHQMAPFPGIKIARDLKYGPDDLNNTDVFSPESAGPPRPVLVLIHGGGFVRGDKVTPNTPFLDNVPAWATRNGMIGVNANYRLAPKVTYPSGPEDLKMLVNWLRANIANYGGDPNRIYLMGYSAGGGHVANYVAFPEFHAAAGGGIAGAIFLSASPFDTTVFDMKPYEPYFGADASKYAAISPTPGLLKTDVPMMIAYAGLDPPGIEKASIDVIDALCKAQRCPTKAFLKTHSHISIGNAIGTKDTELTDQIMAFMKVGKPTN